MKTELQAPPGFIQLDAVNFFSDTEEPNTIVVRVASIIHIEPFTSAINVYPNRQKEPKSIYIVDGCMIQLEGNNKPHILRNNFPYVIEAITKAM